MDKQLAGDGIACRRARELLIGTVLSVAILVAAIPLLPRWWVALVGSSVALALSCLLNDMIRRLWPEYAWRQPAKPSALLMPVGPAVVISYLAWIELFDPPFWAAGLAGSLLMLGATLVLALATRGPRGKTPE